MGSPRPRLALVVSGCEAAADRWWDPDAKVLAGFYITADIASDKRMIVLLTNSRRPDDQMTCNVPYPVRTTYGSA